MIEYDRIIADNCTIGFHWFPLLEQIPRGSTTNWQDSPAQRQRTICAEPFGPKKELVRKLRKPIDHFFSHFFFPSFPSFAFPSLAFGSFSSFSSFSSSSATSFSAFSWNGPNTLDLLDLQALQRGQKREVVSSSRKVPPKHL